MVKIEFSTDNDTFLNSDGLLDVWEVGHAVIIIGRAIKEGNLSADLTDSNDVIIGTYEVIF